MRRCVCCSSSLAEQLALGCGIVRCPCQHAVMRNWDWRVRRLYGSLSCSNLPCVVCGSRCALRWSAPRCTRLQHCLGVSGAYSTCGPAWARCCLMTAGMCGQRWPRSW